MKLLREKEQRRHSGEHAASKTQIKSRAGTIHDHWCFFIQDALVSGKKEKA